VLASAALTAWGVIGPLSEMPDFTIDPALWDDSVPIPLGFAIRHVFGRALNDTATPSRRASLPAALHPHELDRYAERLLWMKLLVIAARPKQLEPVRPLGHLLLTGPFDRHAAHRRTLVRPGPRLS